MLPSQPNQALIDGLQILQTLAASPVPIGSREMGRMLGIEATRVNRLLRTLAHLEIATQTVDRKYVAGPAMHVLSAQSLFASGLLQTALDPLDRLATDPELTVALGVLWRDKVSYLYHREPGMAAATAIGRIGLYTATISGLGMALLAHKSDSDLIELFGQIEIEGFGSLDEFMSEIAATRERGWAYLVTHQSPLVGSLSLALGDRPYAAVGVSGPIAKDRVASYLPQLKQAACEISNHAAHRTSNKWT